MDISQILFSPPPLCQKQEPCCTFLDFIFPFWWTPRRKKQEHEDCIFPATSICIKYAILMFVKGYHYPFLLVGQKSAKKHPGNGQCPNKCSVWKNIKHIERWFLIPVCVKTTYLLKHHKTRLTYNCAHLRSTKESLTIWVKIFWLKIFWVKIFLSEFFLGEIFFEWTFFLVNIFLVKIFWVNIFLVKILLGEKNFGWKFFLVKIFFGWKFFLGEICLGENFWVNNFLGEIFLGWKFLEWKFLGW